jgi:hypothetical protein
MNTYDPVDNRRRDCQWVWRQRVASSTKSAKESGQWNVSDGRFAVKRPGALATHADY